MDLVIGCNRFVDGADDAWARDVESWSGVKAMAYESAKYEHRRKTRSNAGFNDVVLSKFDRVFVQLRNAKGHCNREHYGVIQRFVRANRDVYVFFEERGEVTLRYFKSIRACLHPVPAMWAIVDYSDPMPFRYAKPVGKQHEV